MDPAHHFIRSLLLHGSTLIGLLGDLAEQLEATGAYPDEEPADVVLEMAAGSVGVHLRRVGVEELSRAAELMELAVEAVFADLGKAIEIAERRGNGYRMPFPR
jgi:hypothetical protein